MLPLKARSRPETPNQRSSNPGSLDVQPPGHGQELAESSVDPRSNIKGQLSSRANKRPADDIEMIDAHTDSESQPQSKRLSTPEHQRRRLKPNLSADTPERFRSKTFDHETSNTSVPDAAPAEESDRNSLDLFKQPESRAITVPQLIQEVKGIYAGLG